MKKISIKFLLNTFFVLCVVFFMSTLKFTLGLTSISTLMNLSLFVIVTICILHGLAVSRFDHRSIVLLFFSFCIIFSCLLSLLMHWSYIGLIKVAAYLLPWLVLVMVIVHKEFFLQHSMRYWRWFNLFLVITCFIGLCEYFSVFVLGYRPPVLELNTGSGIYWVGYTTLFNWVEGLGVPYFRFHGPFGEPGNLAMWASLLVVYNLLRRQYAFSIIFLAATVAAFSPSAIVGFLIVFLIYLRSQKFGIASLLTILTTCVIAGAFLTEISDLYSGIMVQKETSLGSRSNATTDFLNRLPYMIQNHPFGIGFFETTAQKVESGLGVELSYGPIYSYEIGGLIAFLSYIFFVLGSIFISSYKIVRLKTSLIENEVYIYCLMVAPYIIQRQSLYDYAITPLLFASLVFSVSKKESISTSRVFLNR